MYACACASMHVEALVRFVLVYSCVRRSLAFVPMKVFGMYLLNEQAAIPAGSALMELLM